MTHTYEEIKVYINDNFDYLNLSEKEEERYIKFINKMDNYINSHPNKFVSDTFILFQNRIEELYAFFRKEGHSEEKSIFLTKKAGLLSDRKNIYTNLSFIRAINLEEKVLAEDIIFFRRNIDEAHARKAYLVSINDIDQQTIYNIMKTTTKSFEEKFNVNMTELLKQYPITEELKSIWAYQVSLTDEKLKQEFGLSREQLAMIYPITKDELETIKKIGTSSNEEIINKYGITKEELLRKYPLNRDTLKAIMSINKAKEETVNHLFGKPKQEVLKLRTITTDMILLANQKIKLKHKLLETEIKQQIKKKELSIR